MNKLKKLLVCTSLASVMAFSSGVCAVTAFADWHKNTDGEYYYTLEDGDKVTGWQTIGGYKYYFSADGYAVTGFRKIKGKTYYLNPERRGRMATGFKKIDENIYYFGSDGVMRTGWKTVNDKTYYFNSKGKAATGKVKIDGKIYTFSKNGVLKSSESSSSSKSDVSYDKNPFGNASFGMSYDDVVSKNKLKNFVNMGDSGDYHIIMFQVKSFLGARSDDMFCAYIFDKEDKLLAMFAVDFNANSIDKFNAYAKGKYKLSYSGDDVTTAYFDDNMEYMIEVGNLSGADLIIEFRIEDSEIIEEALSAVSDSLE